MPNVTKKKRIRRRTRKPKHTFEPDNNLISQVPGENFVNFDESSKAPDDKKVVTMQSTSTDNQQKVPGSTEQTKNTSGNIHRIEPVQRGLGTNYNKKDKVGESSRNIHVVMDHTVKQDTKPNTLMNDIYNSHLSLSHANKLIPPIFMNRPRGIPVSFLMRQRNVTAIIPQKSAAITRPPVENRMFWSPNTINVNESNNGATINNSIYSQGVPTYGQTTPVYGQVSSVYGQTVPTYDQGPQTSGQQTQTFDHTSDTFNQSTPSYNQSTPSYNQSTPSYNQSTPSYNQQTYDQTQTSPMLVNIDNSADIPQEQYSPTDIYNNINEDNEDSQESDTPDLLENKQKRLSAFQRLGPQAKTKKAKLTINLCLSKDQQTREVVEETKYIPVYEREEIMESTDPTVAKFRSLWPWKGPIPLKRSVTARYSKTVMMMEKEQVEEEYMNDNVFMIVSVKGYPPSWTKENVLDVLLENLNDKSFIPCFIEFTPKQCKFLVNRCRAALLVLHLLGFSIRKGDVELMLTISVTLINTKQLEYIPRLVLRNRLSWCCSGGRADLKEFTLKSDISNFIYFPLNRLSNQTELMDLLHGLDFDNLQELDLSYNRLTTIAGFNFITSLPRLKHLNLSYNALDNVKTLLPMRGVHLRSLWLEGNPLCLNYVHEDHYIKVVKTIFPCLRELDGVFIHSHEEMPKFKQNYCSKDAQPMVENFLETFFRLLDLEPEQRDPIENLYHTNAILTSTCRKKLRYEQDYREFRLLFLRSRCLEEGNLDYVQGSEKIGKLIHKWPTLQHDPHSFSVDVMMHNETSTVIRVDGVLRTASHTDEKHLLAFSRTVLLVCENDLEYKISNEMVYWDEPVSDHAESAFKVEMVQKNTINLEFATPLDDESKKSLINIFAKLTDLDKKQSLRCLEEKNWDLKASLDFFMKLLKLDNVDYIKFN